jgi:hypothetical protein
VHWRAQNEAEAQKSKHAGQEPLAIDIKWKKNRYVGKRQVNTHPNYFPNLEKSVRYLRQSMANLRFPPERQRYDNHTV